MNDSKMKKPLKTKIPLSEVEYSSAPVINKTSLTKAFALEQNEDGKWWVCTYFIDKNSLNISHIEHSQPEENKQFAEERMTVLVNQEFTWHKAP